MKTSLLVSVFGLVFLFACSDKNNSQHFYQGFENGQWLMDSSVIFHFDVNDTAKAYNLNATLRHNQFFTFSTFNIGITLIPPSGASRHISRSLPVNNDAEQFKSSEFAEVPFDLYSNIRLQEKGSWEIRFTHAMPVDISRGLVGLELEISPAESM